MKRRMLVSFYRKPKAKKLARPPTGDLNLLAKKVQKPKDFDV